MPEGSGFPVAFLANSIYAASPTLSHVQLIATLQCSALGPLHPSADGRFVVFSSIDNPSELLRHVQEGSPLTEATIAQYAPPPLVQVLDVATGKIFAIAKNAQNPQAQP